jgi:hypothetical protein
VRKPNSDFIRIVLFPQRFQNNMKMIGHQKHSRESANASCVTWAKADEKLKRLQRNAAALGFKFLTLYDLEAFFS